jgi:hypothetical protein
MDVGRFTRKEADRLVGKTFETLIDLPKVPRGTRGLVVKADTLGSGDVVVLVFDWQMNNIGRIKTLRDSLSLSRVEMGRFLQEV